jgi:predicted Rossmann fold nucleotide-binding protein DprA/Smf involved in DNA uptake
LKAQISKIVSGGQTGADRAALDFAIANGIAHGGWCPKGRKAEDGKIAGCYDLQETPSADYPQRTEWNVRDSDGTVVISIGKIGGGSLKTVRLAEKLKKPVLHLSREKDANAAGEKLAKWIEQNRISVLNVAGPRASKEPGVGEFVKKVLGEVLAPSAERVA